MGAQEQRAGDDLAVLSRAAEVFDLGAVTTGMTVAEGLMNRNWRVVTRRGVYAVKQILDVDEDQARRQHEVCTLLAGRSLPVPAPVRTRTGDTVADIDGGLFSVAPWVAGRHVSGLDLSRGQQADLGGLLACLHQMLGRVCAPAKVARPVAVTESATAKDRIDRYLGLIDARPVRDAFDQMARQRLLERRDLLDHVVGLRPDEDAVVGPHGWSHGDFQHLNLLWYQGSVSAVVDWDRLGVRPLAGELVRSATLLFGWGDQRGLDTAAVSAFTAGYRAVNPVSDQQVADAVHRLWWERVCDLWQLKQHYERHDTSCDHLFVSASALLDWWTAHRPTVVAAFTAA